MGSGRSLGDVIALGLLMTICCPYRGQSQELQIVETKRTINALLGQDLTIPCSLTDKDNRDPDLDPSAVNVRWSKSLRDGKEIDVYKYTGSGHEAIRSGAAIDTRELKRGNASLSLPQFQRSDQGEYTCTIIITPYKYPATVNVSLLVQPDVTLSATKLSVEPGSEKSVTCEVSKFYREEVKIIWKKFSKRPGTLSVLDTKIYQSELKENSDGSSNVTSLLIVAPSSPEENGDVYSCVVIHASFTQDMNVSFTLTVTEPFSTLTSVVLINFLIGVILILLFWVAGHFIKVSPEISDIVGVDDLVHLKRSALTFMASGFKLNNIEINLYLKRKGSEEEYKFMSWKYPAPQQAKQYKGDHLKDEGLKLIYLKKGFPLENAIQLLQPKGFFMSYSCLCSTHITPDIERDEGAELIIEVIHDAVKSRFIVCKMLNISEAEPVGKPIIFHHEKHQAGQ